MTLWKRMSALRPFSSFCFTHHHTITRRREVVAHHPSFPFQPSGHVISAQERPAVEGSRRGCLRRCYFAYHHGPRRTDQTPLAIAGRIPQQRPPSFSTDYIGLESGGNSLSRARNAVFLEGELSQRVSSLWNRRHQLYRSGLL